MTNVDNDNYDNNNDIVDKFQVKLVSDSAIINDQAIFSMIL